MISGSELLTGEYGAWPSFHDAEVVRIALERVSIGSGPELTADVHVFPITSDAPAGQITLRHLLVSFRFRGVEGLQMAGFNGQNVLMELLIDPIADRPSPEAGWKVTFHGLDDFGAEFHCREVAVEHVQPCSDRGEPHT